MLWIRLCMGRFKPLGDSFVKWNCNKAFDKLDFVILCYNLIIDSVLILFINFHYTKISTLHQVLIQQY